MKILLYAHLAWDNIRKNRRLYVPYLLSGICMSMIFYILSALNSDPSMGAIPGSSVLCSLMLLGAVVIAVFSIVFLLYTSSFLMKQRSKELSLYNILGMSKRHVAVVLLFETLVCALICIVTGLALGVLFSKVFQMLLLKMTHSPITPDYTVSFSLLSTTACVFSFIFLLIFMRSAYSVYRSKPIELLNSSRAGEAPPRANALSALLGVVLLAAGYVLAVSVRSAMDALTLFFVAVLLVILGTELCFRSASVYFLHLLRSNRDYYYKPNHFISVSSMSYRMKRNGSSLSIICILSTMVLVTLSCVTCLYIGSEDALRTHYPREIEFTSSTLDTQEAVRFNSAVEEVFAQEGFTPQNPLRSRSVTFSARLEGDSRIIFSSVAQGYNAFIEAMPLEIYNRLCDTDYTLAPDEILASGSLTSQLGDTLTFVNSLPYRIVDKNVSLPDDEAKTFGVVNSCLLILPSDEDLQKLTTLVAEESGIKNFTGIYCEYAFDTGLPDAEQTALASRLYALLSSRIDSAGYRTRAGNRAEFLSTNVGLFFLGIMLSVAFCCAAVLSMYYKQITEGYEDQENFIIMRKVGLSRTMIRKSINSQILTVFFLPLLVSGVHLAFAFPMLSKLVLVFGLTNTKLFILVTLGSFAGFSLLYILVYLITSRTYYRIVTSSTTSA